MSDQIDNKKYLWYGVGAGMGVVILGVMFIAGMWYGPNLKNRLISGGAAVNNAAAYDEARSGSDVGVDVGILAEAVIPSAGVELPVTWGDLGKNLVEKGVIDRDKFITLYEGRIGFGPAEQKLLDDANNGKLRITPDNAGFMLNLLWALGLANKNPILDSGPMVDPRYGGAGNFASTGGWTLAKNSAMDYYSKYELVKLTADKQALVEKVAKGIYRPCCDNSTYFPDCNHGMAMLALLELMAAQGISENDMYKVALQVNAYWFPDTYLTLAKYEAGKNVAWAGVDSRTILGYEYSSASGYKSIRSRVQPAQTGGGGGCGV